MLNSSAKRLLVALAILCGSVLLLIRSFPDLLYTIDGTGMVHFFAVFGFYCSLIILGLTWVAGKFKKKPTVPFTEKSTDHGSAEWATLDQFVAAGNNVNYEGLWLGSFIYRKKPGHLLTVAGSGAGKNACIIIPNLLVNPYGSYVVTDPKGENAFITARNQKMCGQKVYILDPWNLQEQMGAVHGIPRSGFNPFAYIKKNMDELRDNCELIASYLVPERPNAKEPFWDDRARSLIKTCLMHIITDLPEGEHNFWTLYKMVRYSGERWFELLADMKFNESCNGLISIAAEEFIGMDATGPTMSGIKSNAQNATGIFESPQLQESMLRSDFDPYELSDGNCTVYAVIPERYLETHSAWLRLVIGLSLKAVNARPNQRVNFILDEFAVLGKMKDIQKAYAFARGQNVVLWAFAQSLSQIKEIYGEDGMNTLIGNTMVFQAFGIKDDYTKEYVSRALGDTTLIKTSYNASTGTNVGGNNNSTSTNSGYSQQSFGRRLLTPEEVEKFPGIINFCEGLKFHMLKLGYWQNRFEGMHWKDQSLSKEQQQLIKSGKLPSDAREYFSERADQPSRIIA